MGEMNLFRKRKVRQWGNFFLLLAFMVGYSCGNWTQSAVGAEKKMENRGNAEAENVTQKTLEADWCTITYPEKAIPGETFNVQVTLKEIPSGKKIGGDLHHSRAGAYVGFASWGGNPKDAKTGETVTFRYKMPDFVAENQGAQPIFYLSEKGWNEAELKAFGPVILPLMNDEIRSRFRPKTATLKKSWLVFGAPRSESGGEPVWKSGEKVVIPGEYYVDPSDDWGKTTLSLWILGPWVDCPDGKYTEKRQHFSARVGVKDIECEIGKRVKTSWTITLPKAYAEGKPEEGKMGDSLLLVGQFKGRDKKNWPWQARYGLPTFERNGGYFDVDAPTPGNLFTYEEAVKMLVRPTEEGRKLDAGKIRWRVTNTQGKTVLEGTENFPPADGKMVEIPMKITEKGTFLFRVELPGKETREVTFARIPDVEKVLKNGPSPFGGQKIYGDEEAIQAARKLGMSVCRVWANWKQLEPAPGVFPEESWKELRRNLDVLNRNKIRPWILIDGIPPWAIQNPEAYGAQFTALPLKDADIERFITRLSREFRDDILGFEWQNEIIPGTVCEDPVADYLRFCRVADAASKRVNPKFRNQMAGGLWPQTFRQGLIAGGIAEFTDILPIHYGNGSTVRGAFRDLETVGASEKVAVWDNETARGTATWGMPLTEAMRETAQADYMYQNFPDELLAGCEKIVIFGGEASPAGDWSHFWADHSPRPAAAALAVLVNALADARPVGEFTLGKSTSLKLFERPGRPPVMVVSSAEKSGETIRLAVGKKRVVAIDQQGNETELKPKKGVVTLTVGESPYLVEGGDADVLKAQLVLSFPGTGTGAAMELPTFRAVAGQPMEVPVRFTNQLKRPISYTLTLALEKGKPIAEPISGKLAVGAEDAERLTIDTEKALPAGTSVAEVTLKFTDDALPVVKRKILLQTVRPNEIGNLIQNPGFENVDENVDAESPTAAFWGGSGRQGARVKHEDANALGHGDYVYRFEKTDGKYFNIFQNVPKLPTTGGTYVYSFWVRSDNLTLGSNMGGKTVDGENWNRHWLQVFQAARTQPHWQVYTKRLELTPGTESLTPAPVCQGDGWAMMDNVQLVPYEGTEYVGFAPSVAGTAGVSDTVGTSTENKKTVEDSGNVKKITIDGDLSDFRKDAPIPLLGANQLKVLEKSYDWSPKNCSAVTYFNYDAQYLYVGVEVIDDLHQVGLQNERCTDNDAVRIGIHPLNRLPGEDGKAFCLDLSAVSPGGGSGKHTIYRPEAFSGGMKSGSLAKDSSVYDISVRRDGNRTIYEAAIPWTEIGVSGGIGQKIGLSLRLTDCDGKGNSAKPAAYMLWGEGLYPTWSPSAFGILTLTE
ncbi:MAG: hypothetical protein Q4C70_00680 [Planctomycetia bacterium]|nr:hypothetical protein [Planctomycetia bacterium]